MSKRKTIVSVVVLMLIVGIAYWVFGRGNAKVQKVKQMQQEMFAAGKRPSREDFDKFRREMDQLTPDQRRQVMGPGPGGRMRKDMDQYFKLPKDQRAAYLAKQITEMEKRRKEMETQGPPKGPPPDGGGPPPGAGGPGGGPPGGPGGPPGGPPNAAQQRQHLAGMLGRMPASDRARMSAFHDAMAKQRLAMGLSPNPGPPHGGPPPSPPR
ncbi:MAG: hypothetical protein ABFC96_16705 [Thermoguttaceae bacterium]